MRCSERCPLQPWCCHLVEEILPQGCTANCRAAVKEGVSGGSAALHGCNTCQIPREVSEVHKLRCIGVLSSANPSVRREGCRCKVQQVAKLEGAWHTRRVGEAAEIILRVQQQQQHSSMSCNLCCSPGSAFFGPLTCTEVLLACCTCIQLPIGVVPWSSQVWPHPDL